MTLTEIRALVIARMVSQTAMGKGDITYPNDPTFDPSGKSLWARLTNLPGPAGANEIGAGPVVQRTGVIIIQLFAPSGSRSLAITAAADKMVELFEFQDDGRLSYFAASAAESGETDGWYQWNVSIPYRAI